MKLIGVLLHALGILVLLSCGATGTAGGGGGFVSGTARFLNGASPTARAKKRRGSLRPANGKWVITPDKVKVTIKRLEFINASGPNEVELSGCEVEFDHSAASLSQVLDCDVQVPVGTFTSLRAIMADTAEVTISDSTNNFYTDADAATKIAVSAPAGGADAITFTALITGGNNEVQSTNYLVVPYEVAEGDTPVINIVGDLTHTIKVEVVSGVPTFDINWASVVLPVSILPAFGDIGKIAFYSSSGTAETFHRDTTSFVGTPGTHSGETEVRVFYGGDQPTYLFLDSGNIGGTSECGDSRAGQSSRSSGAQASAPSEDTQSGGYLGLATDGSISWARAQGSDWTNYKAIFTMPEGTNVGDTGTLKCKAVTSDPAPTSGDTYASGAPDVSSPDATALMTLVAH